MSVATLGWEAGGGEDSRGALRWLACLVVAIAVHASFALGLVTWSIPVEPPATPEAVMMIDLAPLPPAPQPEPAPPEPQPVKLQPPPPPPPPEPEPEPVVEKLPEPPPKVEPVVVLHKPKPKPPKVKPAPQPVERPPEPREPEPATPTAAAPKVETPAPAPAAAGPPPTFQSLLLAHLQRHKRYPRAAQLRRQQGVAQLRFTMDRDGKVIWYRIERGSGSELLDEEVTSMIERAQPLPKIPDDVPDKQLEFLVPVQFLLK